jgi:hypothetical protein
MTGELGATSVAAIAKKFGVSTDAVDSALVALRRGNGRMAQFSHGDFGGMAQWSSGGMSMVGDMFNSDMKAKLNGVMEALTNALRNGTLDHNQTGGKPGNEEDPGNDERNGPPQTSRWPIELGTPSTSGSQNEMHYAFFPSSRRLAIEKNGTTTYYDTGVHEISGVSQQQSDSQSICFNSQHGSISLSDLTTADPPQ